MSELTPEIFNRKMAELEGFVKKSDNHYEKDGWITLKSDLGYYNDLNLLMPLIWKYDIDPVITRIDSISRGENLTKEEQIESLRQRLMEIAK